ncbi:MAG: hypothetical protein ACOCVM_04865 [Desulfovibrionaceae bacterium]
MPGLIWISEQGRAGPGRDVFRRAATVEDLRSEQDLDAEILAVDAHSRDYALQALSAVRQNPSLAVYPLPVVLAGDEDALGRQAALAADRVVSRDRLDPAGVQQLQDAFAPWLKRLRKLKEASEVRSSMNSQDALSPDANLGVRMLRYLYIRREEMAPARGVWSIYGYHYPQLAMFLETEDASVAKMLKYLESQALLHGEFHDKVFACARCGCHYLNFREVCPHCRSANLKADDLVHHFHCGHVAPEPEFRDDKSMVCPKCDRELKRLGSDYDKPSVVYTCRDCGHTFQDPDISAVCFNCGYTAEPDGQIHMDIKRYSLASLGENAAIHGLTSLFKEVLTQKMQVVDMETFQIFLEQERLRIQRYEKSDSSLIYFSILNLGELHRELGEQTRAVFTELVDVVAATLRDSDVISPLNDSTYLALLVETPGDGAKAAVRRLEKNIAELLQENVDREASIKTGDFSVTGDEHAADLLKQVTDQANAE